jgi:hypothetical protein
VNLWRCDADDCVRIAVKANRLADKRLVASEHALPERMGDDGHANGRPESIIIESKRAAEWDSDTKNLEVIAAHELPDQRFRLTIRIQRDGHLCISRFRSSPSCPNDKMRRAVRRSNG